MSCLHGIFSFGGNPASGQPGPEGSPIKGPRSRAAKRVPTVRADLRRFWTGLLGVIANEGVEDPEANVPRRTWQCARARLRDSAEYKGPVYLVFAHALVWRAVDF